MKVRKRYLLCGKIYFPEETREDLSTFPRSNPIANSNKSQNYYIQRKLKEILQY